MQKKNIFLIIGFCVFTISLNAQTNTIKFLKGNISDKTAAVREASPSESNWITKQAIEFCLENKSILGNDRELDGLAVAAILSISNDSILTENEEQKKLLGSQLNQLYTIFDSSSTVEIALLNKAVSLKGKLNLEELTGSINAKLKNENLRNVDSGLLKTTFSSLKKLGNPQTFVILYYFLNENTYSEYKNEMEETLAALAPQSANEIMNLINDSDNKQLQYIYKIISKNEEISKNNLAGISEKILIRSILLMESSSSLVQSDIELQINIVNTLAKNKWTRASSTILSYFETAKKLYESNKMDGHSLSQVINSLSSIAGVNAVSPLITYLEELNKQKEDGIQIENEIILSVINTLGVIGDKSAFDSLLSATYLDYDESVLSAAREALSGLRWQ